MRVVLAVLCLALLSGCAAIAINQARADYDRSRAAYKACIASNPVSACARERELMRADARALAIASRSSVLMDAD